MDDILNILKIIAAVLNMVFGALVIWQPQTIASASRFELIGPRGIAEMRVGFGGFFLGMGAAALLLNDDAAFQLFGLGYLAAFSVRVISLFIDDREILLDNSYLGIGAVELLMAVIFLI
jgi:hypothetical protein